MVEKINKALNWLIYDRSDLAMLIRTVVEAVLGYISANILYIVQLVDMTPEAQKLTMGLFTVVYSAVLGWVRKKKEQTATN